MPHEPGHAPRLRRAVLRPLAFALVISILLLAVDFGLRALGTSSTACHTVPQGLGEPVIEGCETQNSSAVVIYLPGVVARAATASAPVIATWLEVGDVQLVDYLGDRFQPDAVARSVAAILQWDANHYSRIHIYAESLGCFIAADALSEARRIGTLLGNRLRLLLGDCPSGPSTMKPNSDLARFFYAGPIAEGVADGIAGAANLLTQSRGIKGDIIWSWSSSSTPASKFEAGVDVVRTQAQQRENSAGFSLSAFTDQVRYIRDGVPSLEAAAGGSVAYLMCQPSANGSVVQPQAMRDWVSAAARFGIHVHEVALDFPSGHIDYWAWPNAWNQTFREHLPLA